MTKAMRMYPEAHKIIRKVVKTAAVRIEEDDEDDDDEEDDNFAENGDEEAIRSAC